MRSPDDPVMHGDLRELRAEIDQLKNNPYQTNVVYVTADVGEILREIRKIRIALEHANTRR